MESIPESEAKDRLAELIRSATEEQRQYKITSKAGNIIVLSEETFENILVTLELLSTPGLMDNVKFYQNFDSVEKIEYASISTRPS